jgi:hypothetical protein
LVATGDELCPGASISFGEVGWPTEPPRFTGAQGSAGLLVHVLVCPARTNGVIVKNNAATLTAPNRELQFPPLGNIPNDLKSNWLTSPHFHNCMFQCNETDVSACRCFAVSAVRRSSSRCCCTVSGDSGRNSPFCLT